MGSPKNAVLIRAINKSNVIEELRLSLQQCLTIGQLVLTDEKLSESDKLFLLAICFPGKKISGFKDDLSRSMLHYASALGLSLVVQWLMKVKKVPINGVDHESKYTPLHYALLYGQVNVAKVLLQMGCNEKHKDNENLSPYELLSLTSSCLHPEHVDVNEACEVFAFGKNAYKSLPMSNMGGKLEKKLECILGDVLSGDLLVKCELSTSHSAYLYSSGGLVTCGNDRFGKLGRKVVKNSSRKSGVCSDLIGNEISASDVALGRDHTLILTRDGCVYGCGSNHHYQLGLMDIEETFIFQRVILPTIDFNSSYDHESVDWLKYDVHGTIGSRKPSIFSEISEALPVGSLHCKINVEDITKIIGICCGKFHSIFYSANSIFVSGWDGGQLGQISSSSNTTSSYVMKPRLVSKFSNESGLKMVRCSDAASVVLFNDGEISVMHEYQVRRLTSIRRSDIQKIEVIGGNLTLPSSSTSECDASSLLIGVLLKSGRILLWKDTCRHLNVLTFINFNVHLSDIKDFSLSAKSKMMVVTSTGLAYSGHILNCFECSMRNETRKSRDVSIHVRFARLKQIAQVYRAVSVTSDGVGENALIVQKKCINNFNKKNHTIECIKSLRDNICEYDGNSYRFITTDISTEFDGNGVSISCLLQQENDDERVAIYQCSNIELLKKKCVYFKTLFHNRWNDGCLLDNLKLSLPNISCDVMRFVLHFIHHNILLPSTDLSLLCDLAVATDFLMIDELLQLCELRLISLLSLRSNLSTLLIFTHKYHSNFCPRLTNACLDMASNNLTYVLDAKIFNVFNNSSLSMNDDEFECVVDEIFTSITNHFREVYRNEESGLHNAISFGGNFCNRRTKNYKSIMKCLSEFKSIYGKDLTLDDIVYIEKQLASKVENERASPVKTNEDHSNYTENQLENEVNSYDEKHVTPPSKRITDTKCRRPVFLEPLSKSDILDFEAGFQNLGDVVQLDKSSTKIDLSKKKSPNKFKRLSQKERKQNASHCSTIHESDEEEMKWGGWNQTGKSEFDRLLEDWNDFPTLGCSNEKNVPAKSQSSTPKQEKRKEIRNSFQAKSSVSFSSILKSELEYESFREELSNKSMRVTQIEERAIRDLENFYSIDKVEDEVIIVEREDQFQLLPTRWGFNK